jgi:Tripartite tricarboxylate transporter family receptor
MISIWISTARSADLTIIVGFPPGGGTSSIAKMFQTELTKMGHNVIVDHKAGASGLIATRVCADKTIKNTICLVSPSQYLKIDKEDDKIFTNLEPMFIIGHSPMVLYTSSSAKFTDLASNHKILTVGSSTRMMNFIMTQRLKKTQHTTIEYKGTGQLVLDVLGKHIEYGFSPYVAIKNTPNITILAVGARKLFTDIALNDLELTTGPDTIVYGFMKGQHTSLSDTMLDALKKIADDDEFKRELWVKHSIRVEKNQSASYFEEYIRQQQLILQSR